MARVFISYKRVDKAKVLKLKDTIEAAIGEECWIDLEGIECGDVYKDVIINAINKCEVFLFMYSKTHSTIVDVNHDWTVRELNFAEKKNKRIVLIKIDGSKLSDRFNFDYDFTQQVDATLKEDLDRLCTNLQKWLGCSTQSTNKQTNHVKTLPPSAMVEIGHDYYFGRNGKRQNYAEAVKWYSQAAEQGHTYAQFNLGLCYAKGNGVKKDYEQAVKWYRKAAEQGLTDAQHSLGICLNNGDGIKKDPKEAAKWLLKAAQQGHVHAKLPLDLASKLKNKIFGSD